MKKNVLTLSLLVTSAVAFGLCMLLRVNFTVASILFFLPPAVLFSVRRKDMILETAFYALCITVFLLIPLDYIATLNGAWEVPYSVFSMKILKIVPLDDLVCGVLYSYCVVIFYHAITPHTDTKQFSQKRLGISLSLVVVPFAILYIFFPELLIIPYAYFCIGSVFSLIPIIYLLRNRKDVRSFFAVALPLFFVLLLYEIQGLLLGQWVFTSDQYIGWIHLSIVSFPIEEALFWMFAVGLALLAWYESCREPVRVT